MREIPLRILILGVAAVVLGYAVLGFLLGWTGAVSWTAFLVGVYLFIDRMGDAFANQVYAPKGVFRSGLDRVRALLVDERNEEAVVEIRALLARAPEDEVVREFLADTLAKLGRHDDSRIEYERIFREARDPRARIRAAHRAADRLLSEEKHSVAEAFLREAATLLERIDSGAAKDLRTRADSLRPSPRGRPPRASSL